VLSDGTNVGRLCSGDGGKLCQGNSPTDREPHRYLEVRRLNNQTNLWYGSRKETQALDIRTVPSDVTYFMYHHIYWARGGAVGRGNALQAGRSRVRFQMML
jgi:hypothetical protein